MKINQEQKDRLIKLMAGATIVVLAGFLYYVIIKALHISVPCPLKLFTGIICPGCGTTRMAMAMLRFDFAKAFSYQPVLFCATVPLVVCFSAMAVKYVKTGTKLLSSWQNIIIYSTIIALVLYCVYLNALNFLGHIN